MVWDYTWMKYMQKKLNIIILIKWENTVIQ